MLGFGDSFFKKVENKTNVNKETILGLANKLQQGDLKDEKTLRGLIKEISTLIGKSVSQEKEDKIIKAVTNNNIPDDIEKLVD